MRLVQSLVCLASGLVTTVIAECPDYTTYYTQTHPPFSEGKYQLSYQRPDPACRKFNLSDAEAAIEGMRGVVKDPDLFRLFENAFPNTLDTTVSWKGCAADNPEEEV